MYLWMKCEPFPHVLLLQHQVFTLLYFIAELRSDSEKKSQIESLKLEISNLKEQIVQQQQDLQAKIAQVRKPEHCHRSKLYLRMSYFKLFRVIIVYWTL